MNKNSSQAMFELTDTSKSVYSATLNISWIDDLDPCAQSCS